MWRAHPLRWIVADWLYDEPGMSVGCLQSVGFQHRVKSRRAPPSPSMAQMISTLQGCLTLRC